MHKFHISETGAIISPDFLLTKTIKINNGKYKIGLGGLHSTESNFSSNHPLFDYDVTSYYPAIIINNRFFPDHLGDTFLNEYIAVRSERVAAKKSGNLALSNTLKIVLNGLFGKLKSKYSVFYSPSAFLHITLTGQLALLMLIERMELEGVECVSANTDGVLLTKPHDQIIADWEGETMFNLERTNYTEYFGLNVNNYFAQTDQGKIKRKGVFGDADLGKNPQFPIIQDAVIEQLINGVSVDETINNCFDPAQLVSCRQVKGGAVFNDNYIGKVVRFYYSKTGSTLHYKTSGNKVPDSDGASPLMDLDDFILNDVDKERYISEAYNLLNKWK